MLSIWSKLHGLWGGRVPVGIRNPYPLQTLAGSQVMLAQPVCFVCVLCVCALCVCVCVCVCLTAGVEDSCSVRGSWLTCQTKLVLLTHFVCRELGAAQFLWVKQTPSNAPLWSRMWHRVARYWLGLIPANVSNAKSVHSDLIVQGNTCKWTSGASHSSMVLIIWNEVVSSWCIAELISHKVISPSVTISFEDCLLRPFFFTKNNKQRFDKSQKAEHSFYCLIFYFSNQSSWVSLRLLTSFLGHLWGMNIAHWRRQNPKQIFTWLVFDSNTLPTSTARVP